VSTLVLTEPHGIAIVHCCRAHERVLVRLRAWRLDTALASGVSADSSAALSLRARMLIGARTRRKQSAHIRRVLQAAVRSPDLRGPAVPVCRQKVLTARPALEALAERLERPGPVDARGVAHVRLLLRDGGGPLYSRPDADDLEHPLHVALDALEIET